MILCTSALNIGGILNAHFRYPLNSPYVSVICRMFIIICSLVPRLGTKAAGSGGNSSRRQGFKRSDNICSMTCLTYELRAIDSFMCIGAYWWIWSIHPSVGNLILFDKSCEVILLMYFQVQSEFSNKAVLSSRLVSFYLASCCHHVFSQYGRFLLVVCYNLFVAFWVSSAFHEFFAIVLSLFLRLYSICYLLSFDLSAQDF